MLNLITTPTTLRSYFVKKEMIMASVRNPLGPLIGKAEELTNIGKHLTNATIERGENAIGSVIGLGKGATHIALDTAKKPVEAASDAAEIALGLTTNSIKRLGNFASGLLPALGDRNSDSSSK